MKKLPVSAMENLLKKAGAKRVSESAKDELAKHLIKKIETTTAKSQELAEHASRKTIKKQDIEMALDLEL